MMGAHLAPNRSTAKLVDTTDEELAQMEVMHRDYLDRYVRAMEESEEREESEGSED